MGPFGGRIDQRIGPDDALSIDNQPDPHKLAGFERGKRRLNNLCVHWRWVMTLASIQLISCPKCAPIRR